MKNGSTNNGCKKGVNVNIEILNNRHQLDRLQREELLQYSGWGGKLKELKQVDIEPELRGLLELSGLTAYYTPDVLVEAMWQILERDEFYPQSVLEPSCGIGRFFEPLYRRQENPPPVVCGIELDPIAAAIAQRLYPQATIHNQRYETFLAPPASFDLVIGNIPFANITPQTTKFDWLRPSIHDWFILRSLELLKPGGRLLFISTTYVLDGKDQRVRQYLATQGMLLNAWRFVIPEFPVPLDLLYFIKHTGNPTQVHSWQRSLSLTPNECELLIQATGNAQTPDEIHQQFAQNDQNVNDITLNEFFFEKSDNIIGKLVLAPDKVNFGKLKLMPQKVDTDKVKNFLQTCPLTPVEKQQKTPTKTTATLIPIPENTQPLLYIPSELQTIQPGQFYPHQESYYFQHGYNILKVVNPQWHRKIEKMITIYDYIIAIDNLYQEWKTQTSTDTQKNSEKIAEISEKLTSIQKKLRDEIAFFISRWGRFFPKDQPELGYDFRFYRIVAVHDHKGNLLPHYQKPIPPEPEPTSFPSLRNAFLACLNRFGTLNIDWLAQQTIDTTHATDTINTIDTISNLEH